MTSCLSWCRIVMSIKGAEETVYNGEEFELRFRMNERYPFDSPEVVFQGHNIPLHPHVYRYVPQLVIGCANLLSSPVEWLKRICGCLLFKHIIGQWFLLFDLLWFSAADENWRKTRKEIQFHFLQEGCKFSSDVINRETSRATKPGCLGFNTVFEQAFCDRPFCSLIDSPFANARLRTVLFLLYALSKRFMTNNQIDWRWDYLAVSGAFDWSVDFFWRMTSAEISKHGTVHCCDVRWAVFVDTYARSPDIGIWKVFRVIIYLNESLVL